MDVHPPNNGISMCFIGNLIHPDFLSKRLFGTWTCSEQKNTWSPWLSSFPDGFSKAICQPFFLGTWPSKWFFERKDPRWVWCWLILFWKNPGADLTSDPECLPPDLAKMVKSRAPRSWAPKHTWRPQGTERDRKGPYKGSVTLGFMSQ